MTTDHDIELLRKAFTSGEGSTPGCPGPESIWAAVRGELPPDETRKVVDHTSICPSCAEDWRLAVAFGEESAGAGTERVPGRVRGLGRLLRTAGVAAAAALVVAAAGITLVDRQAGPSGPVFREGERMHVRSLVPEGEVVPRDHCLLSWEVEDGVLGSTYHVIVGTEDMKVVADVDGLTRPVYTLPAEALSGLPPSATLFWRVEVTTPSGAHLTSRTFRIRVR